MSKGVAPGVGFEAFGKAGVGVGVDLLLRGALAQTAGPGARILRAMLPTPGGETSFRDDFVERSGIVEHLFDVPWCETQRIVAIREIAF